MALKCPRIKNVSQRWFEYHFYIIQKGIRQKIENKSMTKISGDFTWNSPWWLADPNMCKALVRLKNIIKCEMAILRFL